MNTMLWHEYVFLGSLALAALVYHMPALRAALKYLGVSPVVPVFLLAAVAGVIMYATEPGQAGMPSIVLAIILFVSVIWGIFRGVTEGLTWKV